MYNVIVCVCVCVWKLQGSAIYSEDKRLLFMQEYSDSVLH